MPAASSSSSKPRLAITSHKQRRNDNAVRGGYGYNSIKSQHVADFVNEAKDWEPITWRHRGDTVPYLPFKTALMTELRELQTAVDGLQLDGTVDSSLYGNLQVTSKVLVARIFLDILST